MAVSRLGRYESLQRVARLTARLFWVPVSCCTSAGGARTGVGLELLRGQLTPFEAEAMKSEGVFVVKDATKDARFRSAPVVAAPRGLRFYAAVRLDAPAGTEPHLLSIMDFVSREFNEEDRELLAAMAAMADEVLSSLARKFQGLRRLAGVSGHDLHNCLTIIEGYGKLALETIVPDDPIRQNIEEICHAADRAAVLTSNLLRFSRAGSRGEPANLKDLIRKMQNLLEKVVGEEVELELRLAPDLGMVTIERATMEAGILGIAGRARNAMPEGGKLVIATTGVTFEQGVSAYFTGPGDHILLTVTDTGAPLEQAAIEEVFEPYAMSRGLELATLAARVSDAGGDIRVTSEPDQGCTFEICLPVCPVVSEESHKRAPSISQKPTETILVVDDEFFVRRLIKEVLGSLGYTIIEAADGKEALTAAQSHSGTIHLLFTDVTIPGMSGTEIASAVKEVRPGIKVIYASAYDESLIARRANEERPAYLSKPFTRDQLTRKVREVLDHTSGN